MNEHEKWWIMELMCGSTQGDNGPKAMIRHIQQPSSYYNVKFIMKMLQYIGVPIRQHKT